MFAITKVGDRTNSPKIREYTLDKVDDLQNLPNQENKGTQTDGEIGDNDCCATGSSAFVIETAQLFMLNSEGDWIEV